MTLKTTIAAGLSALVLAGCQTAPQATTSAPPSQVVTMPAAQSTGMAALLSAERGKQGRSAVVENARLSAAAQAHAEDMVRNSYFSHTGLNGSRFSQRARAAGYGCARAENIAFGQRSEAEVVTEWMGSSGHRRNILLRDAREFGVGRSGNTWVLMLGTGC